MTGYQQGMLWTLALTICAGGWIGWGTNWHVGVGAAVGLFAIHNMLILHGGGQ